jgi:glycerophosphoryl diester phosphodiesterase
MNSFVKLIFVGSAAIGLIACNGDEVEVVTKEVETLEVPVIVKEVELVEVPTIVEVPAGDAFNVQLGSRPYFLIEDMDESELKTRLQACSEGPFYKTDFSIGHRGAPMQYPEHTKESYEAAARMGAGILECDVTFTQDKELVCRHSQCDLHTTTNILETDLADKCTTPFTPADPAMETTAQAKCCTSDITLTEFKTLQGKMDAANVNGTTVEEYLDGTANWRTDLYSSQGTLLSHAESIELFKSLNVKMIPELKSPSVDMPFDDFSQQDYAQKMLDEYKDADVSPEHVWPQSFNLADVEYWITNESSFANQAVYLDGRYDEASFDINNAATWLPSMTELAEQGVKIIAPPVWMLVTEQNGKIVPSEYAKAAKNAGLGIITWTLERSGPLTNGGGWYYQTIGNITNNDGDQMTLLHVLAQEVGVLGVFSDWPGTTTYYASCMGMPASI